MIDLTHKRAEAHTVTQEHKLVLELRAFLSRPSQVFDGLSPLFMRQLCLASECMQMVHEGSKDIESARIWTEL